MLFYIQIDNQRNMRFSPSADMDKPFGKVLKPGLPLGYLQYYLKEILSDNNSAYVDDITGNRDDTIVNLLTKGLKKDGALLTENFTWYTAETESSGLEPKNIEKGTIDTFLINTEGRQITEREICTLAKKIEVDENYLIGIMDRAAALGFGEWLPAVSRNRGRWRCERCGSFNVQEWPSFFGQTATCVDCQILGPQTSLQAIFRRKYNLSREVSTEKHQLTQSTDYEVLPSYKENLIPAETKKAGYNERWTVEFTPSQTQTANKLLEHIRDKKETEVLLWAACGAGKTELCFPLIEEYLSAGKKILFTAPRQDVVHDIYPRLQMNFPGTKMCLLSGGVPQVFDDSIVTVATTHQLLKYCNCFDLIIFDEMDAYPYSDSPELKNALKKSLKRDGQIVYLSATPSDEILRKSAVGQCPVIRLPERHHGYPLPVPQWIKIDIKTEFPYGINKILLRKPPYRIDELLKELIIKGPLLIFVPTVGMVNSWVEILGDMLPSKRIEGSWSTDPVRRRKVEAFTKQEYDIFVSTSILERGVTIPNIQVIVFNADHEVFDVRSLVQMAGRVGRTEDYPTGTVFFLAPRETKTMKSARKWIEEQNSLKTRQGEDWGYE